MTSRINGRLCMQVPIDVTPLSKSSFASSTSQGIYCQNEKLIVINLIPLPVDSNRSLKSPKKMSALSAMEKLDFWATPFLRLANFKSSFLGFCLELEVK